MFLVAGTAANQGPKFKITDKKLYVPVVPLSTQDNVKLLKQLELDFKRTINWNKYQSKISTQAQNWYLDFLIDPIFQGVNRIFVLSFENEIVWESYKRYFFSKNRNKRLQCYDWWRNILWSTNKNDQITYDNIRKIATDQGDDYTTGCLLDYLYFKENYKLTAIDLSKQQKLDADSKAMQQINFTVNLERDGNIQMFFIIEETKETA